jgi:hypothetical protein
MRCRASAIGHRDEPGSIQALGTKASVERFDKPVVSGFSGSREVELNLVQISPLVEHPAGELGTIVDAGLMTANQRTAILAAWPNA